MTFDDLLNGLLEKDKAHKQSISELESKNKMYEGSLQTISKLQKDVGDKADQISRLIRQSIAQRVIGAALCFDMLDVQYKFGGVWEKDKAFDCSAFMQICFRVGTQGKVALPRTSHQQSLMGTEVPLNLIEPGDTLHYDFDGDGKITHVGLAMGDELMIHTNNTELDINIIKIADYNKGKGLVRVRRHINL